MTTNRNRPNAVITSAERQNSKSVDNQNIRLQRYIDKTDARETPILLSSLSDEEVKDFFDEINPGLPAGWRCFVGKEQDAKWFKQHANRTYHMRWATPDECTPEMEKDCPGKFFIAMLIKQIIPGGRIRKSIYWSGKLPKRDKDIEPIFENAIAQLGEPTRSVVFWSEKEGVT